MAWKPFPLRGITSLPPLLVFSTFTASSYEISITDLTYIWTETLSKRDILQRSLVEGTSIDPKEDDVQMQHLLVKIKSAIDGQDKTSLKLRPTNPEHIHENGVRDLLLTIVAELPAQFPDLVWPVRLKVDEQQKLTSQLTFPLLKAQQARLRELDSLIDILSDKDHVIQKLVDKIEAMGAELGHVFAGAMGRGGRKTDRKYAENRVQGLKPLDPVKWKKEIRSNTGKHADGEEVLRAIQAVFDGDEDKDRMDHGRSDDLEKGYQWWNVARNTLSSEWSTKVHSASVPSSKMNDTNGSHDEHNIEDKDGPAFQIQATPPRSPIASSPVDEAADTDEEDDDLDGPSQVVNSQRSFVPSSSLPTISASQTRHLGKIGGHKQDTPIARTSTPPENNGDLVNPDNIESEVEDDLDSASQKLPPMRQRYSTPQLPEVSASDTSQSHSAVSTPRKNGLGKIGGRSGLGSSQSAKLSPEKSQKGRPGIGGRASSSALSTGLSDIKEETHETAVTASSPALTAADQARNEIVNNEKAADRRRQDLKRQLERQAHATVKKKRKF